MSRRKFSLTFVLARAIIFLLRDFPQQFNLNKEKMAKQKFTRTGFETWLTSKSPRTKVGTNQAANTPVDRYLREQKLTVETLPKWAETYIGKVLARPGKTISADAALNLLG